MLWAEVLRRTWHTAAIRAWSSREVAEETLPPSSSSTGETTHIFSRSCTLLLYRQPFSSGP